jgi:Cys-tRNA(Pro)/Cys-tRNA(Cys) deacylase
MSSTQLTTQDVQAFIEAHHIDARLIRDIGHTPTVPAAAEALGVHPDQIVKTLLFLVRAQETADSDPQAVVVISNGTNHIDKKALARRYGVGKKRVKLAPPELVLERVGYPAGGVPPFAHRLALPVLIDPSVVSLADRFNGRIYAGGGDDMTMMELSVAELIRILHPEVLELNES